MITHAQFESHFARALNSPHSGLKCATVEYISLYNKLYVCRKQLLVRRRKQLLVRLSKTTIQTIVSSPSLWKLLSRDTWYRFHAVRCVAIHGKSMLTKHSFFNIWKPRKLCWIYCKLMNKLSDTRHCMHTSTEVAHAEIKSLQHGTYSSQRALPQSDNLVTISSRKAYFREMRDTKSAL